MKKKYNTWRQNREKYGSEAGALRIEKLDDIEVLVDIETKELRRDLRSLKEKGKKLF